MKKILMSIREALGAVVEVMTDFANVWSSNAPMSESVEVLNERIAAVDAKSAQQSLNIKVITSNNKNNKRKMANRTLGIANSLVAYFTSVGDMVKAGECEFTFTKLFRSKGLKSKEDAEFIYKVANELTAPVKLAYSLNTTLPLLRTAIDAYSYTIVRTSIVNRKEATTLLPVFMKECVAILDERVANLMSYYRESNPDFWLQFEDARKVLHSTRHTTIEGTVTDIDSGADLKSVKVTITAPDRHFEDMTDVQGKFKQQELNPELNYTLTFELPDYEPFTTTVEDLKPGEHERLKVKLKKIA